MFDRRQFIIRLLAGATAIAGCSSSRDPNDAAPPSSIGEAKPAVTLPAAAPTTQPTSAKTLQPAVTPKPTLSPTSAATPSPQASPTAAPTSSATVTRPAPAMPEIAQPTTPGPAAWMEAAIEMRRISVASGDQAYGAVVVQNGRIVGLGISKVVVNRDPTAHAEMEAIRDACKRLGSSDLSGCTLYSTSRACCMCETAAYWARIGRMIHGTNLTDAGMPRYCSS